MSLTLNEIDDVLDYLCAVAQCWQIFFLWRPLLKDPKDDMVLELAVTASVRLPDSLHHAARDLAQKEHISINQIIATALAEKISALMTEDYLAARSKRGNRSKFEAAMAKVKNKRPAPEDRL